jgi:quercetin dioxygenase-like cupin family protein
LNEYLMALQELEKTRQESKERKTSLPLPRPRGSRLPSRAGTLTNEIEGGNDVSLGKGEIFIGPDEGSYLPVLDIVHKVTAEASGGSLKIEEWGLPPGEMIPPHTHAREDECSFVLEGELTCYVDGEVVLAPEGSYVIKPRGVAHAFYNAGDGTVRSSRRAARSRATSTSMKGSRHGR